MGIKTLSFQIIHNADMETIWQNLEELGCILLYSETEEYHKKIFGNLPPNLKKETILAQFPQIYSIENIELPEIDWESQWSAHQNYHDGYLHIDLSCYHPNAELKLKLLPGPGFGDHSHPTTRLVLQLMQPFVALKHVLDVGCGSGILSLAAIAMGAKTVLGIDIDQEAVEHSEKNSECNPTNHPAIFLMADELKTIEKDTTLLINMIRSEQEVALEALGALHENVSVIISSGILKEEREIYLARCSLRGWKLIDEAEEDGWLGFILKTG